MKILRAETRVFGVAVISAVLLLTAARLSEENLKAQEIGESGRKVEISDTLHRVVFDRGAFYGASTPVPQWGNGYLVSREIETTEAGAANVRIYDRLGNKVNEASIWFPGSQRVIVYSAMATADGRIIASGHAEKMNGTAAPFIALTDLAGKVTEVLQTKRFIPVNTCQAPDGTVWSFGAMGYDENSQPKPGDMLRHFDFQKGEIGSYLPRSTFPKQLHPGPEVRAYIHCTEQEVLAYSISAGEFMEMKYDNDSPHLYCVEAPAGLRLVGFATTSAGEVFGHFSHSGQNGLYYLALNEAAKTARWRPVEGTTGSHTKPGVITALWGSDGDKLVVGRAEDRAGTVALHWVTPTE